MNKDLEKELLMLVNDSHTIDSKDFYELTDKYDLDEESVILSFDFLNSKNINIEDKETEEEQSQINSSYGHYSNVLQVYCEDISRLEPLTREEEYNLSKLIIAGNEATKLLEQDPYNESLLECKEDGINARNILAEHNLKLVVNLALKCNFKKMDINDLIQEGNNGLIKAAEKYDYRLGCKFSTYAYTWIRKSINQHIKKFSSIISIPESVQDQISLIKKIKNKLMAERHEEYITPEDIYYELQGKLSVEKINYLLNLELSDVSLDQEIGTDGKKLIHEISNEKEITNSIQNEIIDSKVLDKLNERERDIFKLFYIDNMKLMDIALKYDLSVNRIRQIKDRAKRKVDSFLKNNTN